jgi:anti-sigma factor RsiW
MDRTAPTAHAGHDELLIARLFGGDVDEAERAQALDLVADCPECAALFADLGAIADANAAMPVPPRPRDFTLTAADAAGLRRKRHIWSPIFGAGLRRSLGSSLAALGLAGAVLTGVASVLGGAATSAPAMLSDRGVQAPVAAAVATPASADTAPGGEPRPVAIGAAPSGSTAAPAVGPAASPTSGATVPDGSNPVALPPTESTASPNPQFNAASPEIAFGAENGTTGTGGTSGTKNAATDGSNQSGMDARLIWLGGFGALFAIGLAIALLPRLPRGRRRGTRT